MAWSIYILKTDIALGVNQHRDRVKSRDLQERVCEREGGGGGGELTCRTAPELANLRGRETVNGSGSSAKSAKSIEASPR
jgi:hypothetical protein